MKEYQEQQGVGVWHQQENVRIGGSSKNPHCNLCQAHSHLQTLPKLHP